MAIGRSVRKYTEEEEEENNSNCMYKGGNCNCSLREMGSYPECK